MTNALKILTIIFVVAAIVAASGCASNNTQTPTPAETVSTPAETFKQNETPANPSGQNVTVTDENVSAD
jgi:ABC-type Fe3+-citrate transport system substrate-binding protein